MVSHTIRLQMVCIRLALSGYTLPGILSLNFTHVHPFISGNSVCNPSSETTIKVTPVQSSTPATGGGTLNIGLKWAPCCFGWVIRRLVVQIQPILCQWHWHSFLNVQLLLYVLC